MEKQNPNRCHAARATSWNAVTDERQAEALRAQFSCSNVMTHVSTSTKPQCHILLFVFSCLFLCLSVRSFSFSFFCNSTTFCLGHVQSAARTKACFANAPDVCFPQFLSPRVATGRSRRQWTLSCILIMRQAYRCGLPARKSSPRSWTPRGRSF